MTSAVLIWSADGRSHTRDVELPAIPSVGDTVITAPGVYRVVDHITWSVSELDVTFVRIDLR